MVTVTGSITDFTAQDGTPKNPVNHNLSSLSAPLGKRKQGPVPSNLARLGQWQWLQHNTVKDVFINWRCGLTTPMAT